MKLTILDTLLNIIHPAFRAINRDPLSIVLHDNPSERLLSAAIRKNSKAFILIKNPSEQISKLAIANNPSYIRFLNNPSEELQILAVTKDPSAICLISNPCVKAQLKAVTISPDSIKFLENPSVEIVKLYIGNEYKKIWDLNISKEKHEKLFNEIFRSKHSTWNISNDEFISWLSNYTEIQEPEVKDIYNAVKSSSIDTNRLSIKQWNTLLNTNHCQVGNKEITVSKGENTYTVNILRKGKEPISIVSEESSTSSIKENEMKLESSEGVSSHKQEYLKECLKHTRKQINESVLLSSLKENNLSLEELSNEQISSLIKKGETKNNQVIIKLKKEPSGYKVKTETVTAEKNVEIQNIQSAQLQESTENVSDFKLSEKQLKEIENKGFLNISGGKLISKVKTPAGYSLKVFNIINTLTRQGQAEA